MEPEEEVEPTWMNGLNCLAHINEPALLFPPQDIVPGRCKVEKHTLYPLRVLLRQISMDKMADLVELHHHLHNLAQFQITHDYWG